jgi:hypothetical protein
VASMPSTCPFNDPMKSLMNASESPIVLGYRLSATNINLSTWNSNPREAEVMSCRSPTILPLYKQKSNDSNHYTRYKQTIDPIVVGEHRAQGTTAIIRSSAIIEALQSSKLFNHTSPITDL